jgi:predicted transcriptional regulator
LQCNTSIGADGNNQRQELESGGEIPHLKTTAGVDDKEVKRRLQETLELSDRQIARKVGVHHTTVGTQRQEMESIGEISQCDRTTSDGRIYPAQCKEMERGGEIHHLETTTGADSKEIKRRLQETPELSDRQIARKVDVSHVTVGEHRRKLEAGGEISHLETTTGADGKEYPRQTERKLVEESPSFK